MSITFSQIDFCPQSGVVVHVVQSMPPALKSTPMVNAAFVLFRHLSVMVSSDSSNGSSD